MELKFQFDPYIFWESQDSYNDLVVHTDVITSYYNENSRPPTIQIDIMGNNPDKFLEKSITMSPKIRFSGKFIYIYPPIERIKDKIK